MQILDPRRGWACNSGELVFCWACCQPLAEVIYNALTAIAGHRYELSVGNVRALLGQLPTRLSSPAVPADRGDVSPSAPFPLNIPVPRPQVCALVLTGNTAPLPSASFCRGIFVSARPSDSCGRLVLRGGAVAAADRTSWCRTGALCSLPEDRVCTGGSQQDIVVTHERC